ncbi:MAG TPA: tRNA epoxyqueuosine(34) reductase QueG [Gemmatimonadales bacterium]|nr:tRNA epoxyqueuosine(34) reductase QueG [Gemmatimonadales bacterium]
MTMEEAIKAHARELGFLACGITHPGPSAYSDKLDEWLARGFAGTMRYLHRQAARRKDPQQILPGAQTVIVVLDNYYTPDTPADSLPPRVAKYARGEDYHRVTSERLELLADFLRGQGARLTRTFADAGPVPERELAQRAGLGWIGKNTMLIRPDAGSFFFIGSVFTDLPLRVDPPFELDRCGSCTRCLDACPTDAFVEPRLMDATRCISYLTIEQKGPVPDDLADQFHGYAFGCDICNDVCPWNQRFATMTAIQQFQPRNTLTAAAPELFEEMTDEEFSARFEDTPLERPGLPGMRRNFRAAFRSAEAGRSP